MKRLLGPLLLILLVAGVGTAIYFSVSDMFVQRSIASLHGLVSSDKADFFADPQVQKALKRGGFVLDVESAGSRQIATAYDLKGYDFAFPAGVPSAEKIRQSVKGAQSYDIFYTPMAIATWKPVVQILEANGVASKSGAFEAFNMDAYLKLVEKDTRWKDLTGSGAYPVSKSFLINSTDPRKANTGEMYLALASYTLNGSTVVQTNDQIQQVQPLLGALFLRQGFTQYSSEVPLDDYLTMGMGQAPLLMVYESQFVARAGRADGGITPDMMLIYPNPTILSKAVLVAFNDNAQKLATFMKTDPEMQQLAIQYGYRNGNQAAFTSFKQAHNLTMIPDQVINVIDPPSYEVLEKMIANIDAQYK